MRKPLILATVAVAAVAAVSALSACGVADADGGGSSESTTIDGSITLVSGAYNKSDPRSGTSGQIMSRAWDYTDMTGGAPCPVDADGTVLGSDALSLKVTTTPPATTASSRSTFQSTIRATVTS